MRTWCAVQSTGFSWAIFSARCVGLSQRESWGCTQRCIQGRAMCVGLVARRFLLGSGFEDAIIEV